MILTCLARIDFVALWNDIIKHTVKKSKKNH